MLSIRFVVKQKSFLGWRLGPRSGSVAPCNCPVGFPPRPYLDSPSALWAGLCTALGSSAPCGAWPSLKKYLDQDAARDKADAARGLLIQ
jgi:hypothetical protein